MKRPHPVEKMDCAQKNHKPLGYALCTAVLAGSLVGWALGPRAVVLGELGILLIRLLKALAAPLIFFAVVDAFSKARFQARKGFRLLTISGVNAIVAGSLALLVSEFFPANSKSYLLDIAQSLGPIPKLSVDTSRVDFVKGLSGFVPENILEPFLTNNVISIVVLSILMGLVLRRLRDSQKIRPEVELLEQFFSAGFQLMSGLLSWVVRGVPVAVFGVVAKIVGLSGFKFFSALVVFTGMVMTGIFIHGVIYYSLLLFFVARVSPLRFFQNAGEALATAFATGSSLATLPVTLRTLQEKMKISPESSRLAACVGTNLNHDGILLYEAIAALFVAHVHGIPLGFSQKVVLLGSSTLAAVGIAGVPDAGLITLSLVLGSLGLPLTLVPVFMTVDWFLGRLRAATNVTSDMVVATLLDR